MDEYNVEILKNVENFLNDDSGVLTHKLYNLFQDSKRKDDRINKILMRSDKHQLKVMELNEELNEYKDSLENKVQEEIIKRKEKEKILMHQSKLAAMGEMMDAVAHQWKQPINIINMHVSIMDFDFDYDMIDKKYIKDLQDNVAMQITHMRNTLDEFRNFFRPSTNINDFDVETTINKVLTLVKDELIKNKIKVNINNKNPFLIHGIENEFKHLVLNLINNAKDAFVENETKNRLISINILSNSSEENYIEFIDNAGGIPLDIIEHIFSANITSKAEDKGTGIGLYMSTQIANKNNASLLVENIENGAMFTYKENSICII